MKSINTTVFFTALQGVGDLGTDVAFQGASQDGSDYLAAAWCITHGKRLDELRHDPTDGDEKWVSSSGHVESAEEGAGREEVNEAMDRLLEMCGIAVVRFSQVISVPVPEAAVPV